MPAPLDNDGAMISLLEGLATTRTIRRYTEDPIPAADLGSMLWHASRAPSGSNRQPFRFVVITDSDVAREVKSLLGRSFRSGWAAKVRSDGYDQGSGNDADSPKARMAATMQHYVDNIENVPAIVFACMVRYRGAAPSEGASVYPACQNLLLAARALGYGGALTMWHQLVDDELHALMRIPPEVVIAACITIGRPAGHHGPVRRRPLRDLVFADRWGESAEWAIDPPGTRFTQAGPPRQ